MREIHEAAPRSSRRVRVARPDASREAEWDGLPRMSAADLPSEPDIAALLARGEESGSVELSAVDEVARLLDLTDDDVEALEEEIATRGIELLDDCGREAVPATSYERRSRRSHHQRDGPVLA